MKFVCPDCGSEVMAEGEPPTQYRCVSCRRTGDPLAADLEGLLALMELPDAEYLADIISDEIEPSILEEFDASDTGIYFVVLALDSVGAGNSIDFPMDGSRLWAFVEDLEETNDLRIAEERDGEDGDETFYEPDTIRVTGLGGSAITIQPIQIIVDGYREVLGVNVSLIQLARTVFVTNRPVGREVFNDLRGFLSEAGEKGNLDGARRGFRDQVSGLSIAVVDGDVDGEGDRVRLSASIGWTLADGESGQDTLGLVTTLSALQLAARDAKRFATSSFIWPDDPTGYAIAGDED